MFEQHLFEPSRHLVRNKLSEYIKKPLKIGNNFIQVSKILEKWVVFAESRNDLVQSQKRVPLKDSLIYFEYKKHLLANSSSNNNDLVDPKTQNKQYQTQYENYHETFIDVQNALTIIWRNHSKNFSFYLSDDSLRLEFPGYHVMIKDDDNRMISLSTNYNLSTIDNQMSYTFCNAFSETSRLLFSSTKESSEFNIDFNRLLLFKKQLKLLVSFVQTDKLSEDEIMIRQKVKDFIFSAKKGQSIIFDYDDLNINGFIFKRSFHLIKLTKIRTVVKVITKHEDIELTEFSKTFTKVSHQVDYYADEIQKLYLANK